jgi:hypothetical protein
MVSLSRHLPGGTNENHEDCQKSWYPDRGSKSALPEYNADRYSQPSLTGNQTQGIRFRNMPRLPVWYSCTLLHEQFVASIMAELQIIVWKVVTSAYGKGVQNSRPDRNRQRKD